MLLLTDRRQTTGTPKQHLAIMLTCTPTSARTVTRRLVTRAVVKPPSGKAKGKSPRDELFRTKNASALAYLTQSEGSEDASAALGLGGVYSAGNGASALEQASSLTAAHRALGSTEDEYDGNGMEFPVPEDPYLM